MRLDGLGRSQQDDDQGYVAGWDWDVIRWGISQPAKDLKSSNDPTAFGSSHPNAFNAAFCDGSVRRNRYSINLTVFHNICKRDDGNTINAGDME